MNPRLSAIAVSLLVVIVSSMGETTRAQTNPLQFSCTVFSAGTTAADLRAKFGAANVKTARVPWGGAEGDSSEGTVLFGNDPTAKLEIYWRDGVSKRNPGWVSVRGKHTRWRSPAGVTLGTSLRTIEQLNGRPFRLIGFGSDVQGTVMSWSGGTLEAQNVNGCRMRMRLGLDWNNADAKARALVNQLRGESEFSSGHPSMQSLDPTVNELFLQYDSDAG